VSRLLATSDRLLGGALESLVRDERARGQSFEAIAQEIAVEHNIRVTGQTVRMWARDLGLPTAGDAEATA
jgi:hypothetical protein